MTVVVGGRRFAHSQRQRADHVLHALLGIERFAGNDTIHNFFRRFTQAKIQAFWRPLWRWLLTMVTTPKEGFHLDLDSTVFDREGPRKEPSKAIIRVGAAVPAITPCWPSWLRLPLCCTVVEIDAHSMSFTLITAHLKSRNAVAEKDASELRLGEARILRARVNALLSANHNAKLIVLGDFNDTPDTDVVRTIIGQRKNQLIDSWHLARTNPSNSTQVSASTGASSWTNYYREKNEYSRLDDLLLSPSMAQCWLKNESYILAIPDWDKASDHRPIVASFIVDLPL